MIEQGDRNADGKKKSKISKKKALVVGAKVGKTALKGLDQIADSGVVEQLGCLEGCINAIPCGPLLCCFCKFACVCWKGRKQIKDQFPDGKFPCAGIGPCPGEDAVDEIADVVDAVGDGEPDTTDIVTGVAKDIAENTAEDAKETAENAVEDAKSNTGSTYSVPEWCSKGIEMCQMIFPSKDAEN